MLYLYCWMYGETAHITMSSSQGHNRRPSLCRSVEPGHAGWDVMLAQAPRDKTLCAGCLIAYAETTIPVQAALAGLQVDL